MSIYHNHYIFILHSAVIPEYVNPCQPSPCGPNSQCKEVNNQAVCSCLPSYIGSPPGCRPECVVSSECSYDQACSNQKCIDPCPNTCGQNAKCRVNNHSPICYCMEGYTGDPFTRCYPQPRKTLLYPVSSILMFVFEQLLSYLHPKMYIVILVIHLHVDHSLNVEI